MHLTLYFFRYILIIDIDKTSMIIKSLNDSSQCFQALSDQDFVGL